MSKKQKIAILIFMVLSFILVFISFAYYKKHEYAEVYSKGVQLLNEGNVDSALDCFDNIPNYTRYRDISQLLEESNIQICPNCGAIVDSMEVKR